MVTEHENENREIRNTIKVSYKDMCEKIEATEVTRVDNYDA